MIIITTAILILAFVVYKVGKGIKEVIMAGFVDLKALLTAIKGAITDAGVSLDGVILDLTAYVARIQELLEQLAGGGAITQAQLDELAVDATQVLESIVALRDNMSAADAANPVPGTLP